MVIDCEVIETVKSYIASGLFRSALKLAEKKWGKLSSWEGTDKTLIAIKLYSHLGNDRRSDALLLLLWRKDKKNPDVFYRVLYYKLHRLGPVLALQFYEENQLLFDGYSGSEVERFAFLSIVQRLYKNFTKADCYLSQAISLTDEKSSTWVKSLSVYLLAEQDQNQQAELIAKENFEQYRTVASLRAYSFILQKNQGINASIALLAEHLIQFESSSLWLEHAQLLANIHCWDKCEISLQHYDAIVYEQSKAEKQYVLSLKSQIAIDRRDIKTAIEMLKDNKLPYWKIVTENLLKADLAAVPKILDVPFLRQKHLTCAPTSIAAISQFWGKEHHSKDIAEKICFDGTPVTLERRWLRENGFTFKEFDLNFELAIKLIDKNIPFTLATVDEFSSHLQVVIGYNAQVGTIYIMDPSSSSMQEMLVKETIEQQSLYGANCFAIVPSEQSHLLTDIEFAEHELYVLADKFQLAAEQNDSAMLNDSLSKLMALNAHHRVTQRAQIDFAKIANDSNALLKINNEVLSNYPKLSILRESNFYCLKKLGSRSLALQELINFIDDNPVLSIMSLLFDELRETNENESLVVELLYKLKKYGGCNAQIHWSIASYYWTHQQFELAQNHYLIAHCLDDTSSLYIDSYFKAGRFLNNEQEALSFLKQRYEKYKTNSAVPAISLYKAYSLLDEEHKGFEYLYSALELRSSDIDLLNFLARELIYHSLFESLDKLDPQLKKHLSMDDYLEIIAIKNTRIGNTRAAIEYYQLIFQQKPLSVKYTQTYFNLLQKNDQQGKINLVLSELKSTYPDNTLILDYISDWHDDAQIKETALEELVKLRPDDSEAHRQYIDLLNYLGKDQKALELAIRTNKLFIGDIVNIAYLSRCYLIIGDNENAIIQAKKALSLNIDNETAFDTLMDAATDETSKLASLDFLFEQLKVQVTFGDAAWNYWFSAKAIISQDILQEFIDYLVSSLPHLWYTYSIASMFYLQINRLDEAERVLQEGVEKFPFTPRLHYDLAHVYEFDIHPEKAINSFYNALDQNPSWSVAARELSELLEKNSRTEDAKILIIRTIKHNYEDASLHGFLADIEMRLEQSESALNSLSTALKLDQSYMWAWDQLINICEVLDKKDYPVKLANQLVEDKPNSAAAWRSLAYVSVCVSDKHEFYEKSLSCDSKYIASYADLVQLDLNYGHYQSAINRLEQTPWGDNLPFLLGYKKAQIYFEIGQVEEAIKGLKKLLFNVQGYSHLWNTLYLWLEKAKETDQIVECVERQISLNPHDPEILCKAGEKLAEYGREDDKSKAKQYIEKSYLLAPNDLNTTIVYLDSLIAEENYNQAINVISSFSQFHNSSSDILVREISVLSAISKFSESLERFIFLIESVESNYWMINSCYESLLKGFEDAELLAVFEQRINSLNGPQAYFWAEKICKTKGEKYLVPILKRKCNEEGWEGLFNALLDHWNDCSKKPTQEIIDEYISEIVCNKDLTAALINVYAMQAHFHSVIWVMNQVSNDIELPAYCYYHCSFALQMNNKWDEAGRVLSKALNKPVDYCIHNIRLWFVFELFRTGQPFNQQDLNTIDFEELVSFERYIYIALQVSIALSNNMLENVMVELRPLILQSQSEYVKTGGQLTAKYARQLLKRKLLQASGARNLIAKCKTRLWLFHCF